MIELDSRLLRIMSPMMERVLVVDPSPASARMLMDLLHNIWPGQVWTATSVDTGLAVAGTVEPQMVFVEYSAADLDGLAFTRRLRRGDHACRKAPVIMITALATPGVILGARDAGVHEFLRKPFTNRDLVKRIEAVTRYPRGWIEGMAYVGPDRRRFNSADYNGVRKRRADTAETPEQARVLQALRIVRAAEAGLKTDPSQAYRALYAQALELRRAGRVTGNLELEQAAANLQTYLERAAKPEAVTAEELQPHAERITAFIPEGEARRRTAA